MRNNRPKSENPAMKEHASMDKASVAKVKTTEAEKAARNAHVNKEPKSQPTPARKGSSKL